jgi:oligoribonuclease NrnB/cAMP/cGMP phosphodiesterase (DHH superfamily)
VGEMNEFDTLVVCHGGCMDGTTSAWIVRKYLDGKGGKLKYVFASKRNLDDDIAPLTREDLKGKDIFIVDYMYEYNVIKELEYKSLTIIDHHKSAKESCEACVGLPNTRVFFNQEYSAAGLAWISLIDEIIPWWIQYIQDRDLYRFILPDSREVNDAIYNLGYRSFAKFDELQLFTEEQKQALIEKGKEMANPKMKMIKSVADGAQLCMFHGYRVLVLMSNTLVSHVSEYLYTARKDECDFVLWLQYHFDGEYWKVRVRSHVDMDLDLSSLCKQWASYDHEGGGHKNAAGFSYKGDILSLLHPIIG